jgi:hypothetical protein
LRLSNELSSGIIKPESIEITEGGGAGGADPTTEAGGADETEPTTEGGGGGGVFFFLNTKSATDCELIPVSLDISLKRDEMLLLSLFTLGGCEIN